MTSPAAMADSYVLNVELRQKDPIRRMRLINASAMTDYEDVEAVLLYHKLFPSGENKLEFAPWRTTLDLDPPDHTRLRALVSKAFTPRAVAALSPRIEETVGVLLDALAGKGRFDLISEFAYPLPDIVIAEMLGIPAQDRDRFRGWSDDIALAVEPILTDEEIARVERSSDEIAEYFEDVIEERRRCPEDDLVSALVAAEEAGDRLNHDEPVGTLMLLLVAGNETTGNLIGNGMLALLRHPDQLQRLRERPDLLESAINELLRYDSPVQLNIRVVREDMEFKGKRYRAGQRIMALSGAANCGPKVFPAPSVLDIARREKGHISSGRGTYYCLGAPLALPEARISCASLLERFSLIRLLSEPVPKCQLVLRGVEDLWAEVECSPRKKEPTSV